MSDHQYLTQDMGDNSFLSEDSEIDQHQEENLCLKNQQLQRKIDVLTQDQSSQDEQYRKMRQENEILLTRIHGMEDLLRDLELQSDTSAKEEEKKVKDLMAKNSRLEKDYEQHMQTICQLQQDIKTLQSDIFKNETVSKNLRNDMQKLETEIAAKINELIDQDNAMHKLKLAFKHLQEEDRRKENIISILNEELEEYQCRSQNNGSLEISLAKLREENQQLKQVREELQAQLLNAQVEEGRCLVEEGNKSYSLADEMGDIDVQRLMKALEEQKEVNARLRRYVDEILIKILERNPEILDKTQTNDSNGQS